MDKKLLGNIGESYAEKYLITKNILPILKNFRSRYGEIDIISIDYSKQGELVFIEVKTRTNNKFGDPNNSITYQKKNKIIKTLLYYLSSSIKNIPKKWRIDFIGIKLDHKYNLLEISHIKNI